MCSQNIFEQCQFGVVIFMKENQMGFLSSSEIFIDTIMKCRNGQEVGFANLNDKLISNPGPFNIQIQV